LEVLRQFEPVDGRRRIAALGTMAELGSLSQAEHRMVGMRAAELGLDLLVCVGEEARDIGRAAEEAGMAANQIHYFSDSKEAGRALDSEIRKGDIVLVKGSQSARMEFVVKDLMAEPNRAGELLVRQTEAWLEDNS
jgi:UDP-N-acetylmuramyl pentapeptide synthase